MNKIQLIILFIFLITGCSRPETDDHSVPVVEIPDHLRDVENLTIYPEDAEPAYEIELIRDQTFGDTDHAPVGDIWGITVDESGRVFLIDASQTTIHAFQSDGSYLTRLGRRGEGPGEFSSFQLAAPITSDTNRLYVYDSTLQRIHIFSLESLSHSQTVNINPESLRDIEEMQGVAPMLYSVRKDSLFVMMLEEWPNAELERYTRYYRMDTNGQILRPEDELYKGRVGPNVPIRPTMSIPMFFSRRTLMDMSGDDHIYSAWSEDFLVKVYDPDGNYLRAFYYPYMNRELTREGAVGQVDESYRDAVRNFDDLPDTWPALYSLQIDDENRIWVSVITDDDETYDWWILEENGELIARFTWPKYGSRFFGERQIHVIKNGYLYVREINEETSVNQIVRYRIEMEKI